jgi:hypothetical protein
MVSFISNSFSNDWLGFGAEYAFKETFMARLAYRYEAGIFSETEAITFYTGVSAGVTAQTNIGTNKLAFDYSFRPTRIAGGVHVIGLRFALNNKPAAEE